MKYSTSINPSSIILVDAEVMGGTPCFRGTRVPIQNLYDFIEAGDPLDQFLEAFPTVSQENAILVLKLAKESVVEMVG